MGIKVNLDGVRAKVSPQAMKRGRYALANQAMADMNSFVPKKNNILRQSAHIKSDGSAILYETKYARRQFYLNGKNILLQEQVQDGILKQNHCICLLGKKAYLKGAGIQ